MVLGVIKCFLSVENENDVLGLRTVDKKKRSADAQSDDLFSGYDDGYDYYDETEDSDDLFGGYDYPEDSDDVFGGNDYPEYSDSDDPFDNRDGESEEIRLVQLGVVAWGIGCGQAGMPSVYSSVASARCWLDQVMSCYQPTSGSKDSGDRERGMYPHFLDWMLF